MNNEVKERRKTKKLSIQKIFNLVSIMFLLACILFYGGRFIKLYAENNKTEEVDFLSKNIKNDNKDNENFKLINGEYYFNGKDSNNYLNYSNLIWRIVKINTDNSITIVLNNSITALANNDKVQVNKWLNKGESESSGIFENSLNNSNKYLTYTKTCNDIINDTKTITCKNTISDTYITIPSINDYVNTGASDSFMNNDEYYYLINKSKDNELWYIDSEGKLGQNDGTDIIGIKPVITIKGPTQRKSGNGTKDNPYTFEEEMGLFGSYVKLGNDIWRIYEENESIIKLSLNEYLKINNEEKKYQYSNNGYYHNDTKINTLAYYLNKDYYNSLSYKSLLKEEKFANGIYSNTTNYNYDKVLSKKVSTKITILSIGNPILNPTLNNYFLSTGISENENKVYVMQNDFKLYTKVSSSSLKVVPVIAIDKNVLTKGNGSIETPWEVE